MLAPLALCSDPASFGHHFHVRLNDTVLDDTDRSVLETLRPIGVQITDHNFLQDSVYDDWLEAYSKLLRDVRERIGREKILVSIDHEGGRVHRPPAPITHFPSPADYCDQAAEVAAAMAAELRSLGINLSFSPSLDVHSNASNPVIGKRSFGSDPKKVAKCGVAFAQSLLSAGVMPCVKHFPGHGDTAVDSHYDLPMVDVDRATFASRELSPFREAISVGIDMVMSAHILFPAVDPALPATLSERVIAGLLREELGFDRVVITDDLDMQAIRDHFTEKDLAQKALQAGCDILLFNHEPARAEMVAEEWWRLLESGQVDQEMFEDSYRRIYDLMVKVEENNDPYPLEPAVVRAHTELRKNCSPEESEK